MRFIFVLLTVLVIMSGVLLAQSLSGNDAIPACTPEDAQKILDLIAGSEIGSQYELIEQRTPAQIEFKFTDYLIISREFERMRLQFPDCALAARFAIHYQQILNFNGFLLGSQGMIKWKVPDIIFENAGYEELEELISEAEKQAADTLGQIVELAEEADE